MTDSTYGLISLNFRSTTRESRFVGEGRLETDIRYYRRRACEEMSAASRAVTPQAKERRLYLVNVYLDRLKALNAPSPFDDEMHPASAFAWSNLQLQSEHA